MISDSHPFMGAGAETRGRGACYKVPKSTTGRKKKRQNCGRETAERGLGA